MLEKSVCPVCGSEHRQVFWEMLDIPVFCNILWSDRDGAINCNRGDLKLAFCQNCGFIDNIAFDPERLEYTQVYENALDFSPRFQQYAHNLATRLINTYNLQEKIIIEIGCGKGEFITLLCELGNNRGIGFDPTYVPLPDHEKFSDRLTFIQDLYSEKYANYQGDFICCRHTLEHIPTPTNLLKSLAQIVGNKPETGIFFEVPNALDIFRNLAVWDIIYEHCCYFAPVSLGYAFSSCGFEVKQITEEFRGQFLCLEAQPSLDTHSTIKPETEQVNQLANSIAEFSQKFEDKLSEWEQKLGDMVNQGQRVVIWGSGSKGVTFLNFMKAAKTAIEYVVDINPRKQGMYVAGTGQKIVPPAFLVDYKPDVVIIMNPIYEQEITQMLENLGLTSCQVRCDV
ncbi:MAG: methyltransferase domain-containing protein [Arthrospira sp. SH-MAG29]|nr:class I SAM-dependent methyltransferase [Arthrospira sp. SH-MAG29]MBS0018494.1 methyltransferase domain-containing protein [Arthrospira sp. SH-MAG29]